MCEKAEEIQKGWEPENYDMCINKEKQKIYGSEGYAVLYFFNDGMDSTNYNPNKKDEYFWLPTQEQLQEMILNDVKKLLKSYDDLTEGENHLDLVTLFGNWFMVARGRGTKSINELWLEIVMEKKYNKIWNGKDWELGNDK